MADVKNAVFNNIKAYLNAIFLTVPYQAVSLVVSLVALYSYEEYAQQIASGRQLLQGPRNQPVGVFC